MEKISTIQSFVIRTLIRDEQLDMNNLITAVSKVCSEEQFNNILGMLINTTASNNADKPNSAVRISINREHVLKGKLDAIKVLRKYFAIPISTAKEYIDKSEIRFTEIPITVEFEKALHIQDELYKCGTRAVVNNVQTFNIVIISKYLLLLSLR